jgi:hypothetical protein
MVTFNRVPVLLINRGEVNAKVTPVVKTQKLSQDNNNRRTYEQKKRNVQTTAAVLRISEQRKS